MGSTRRRTTLLVGIPLVLLVFVMVVYLLAGWSPGWFDLAAEDDPSTAAYGEAVEFRLVEELQKIRPTGTTWRLRIKDAEINAWLATRLLPWMSHQPSISWPERLSRPQVRFTSSGIDAGIEVRNLAGSDRVVVLRFQPGIQDGRLTLQPGGVRVGRLPIPFARAAVDSILRESLPGGEDALGQLIATALDEGAMDALIPLVDDRRIRVDALWLEPGSIILEAETLPAP